LGRFFGSAVSNAAGYAIGGAILPTLAPYVQFLANEAWKDHPTRPPSVTTAAEAWSRGILDEAAAKEWARTTGYDAEVATLYRDVQLEAPNLGSLLELERRKLADAGEVADAMRRNNILPEWIGKLRALRFVVPSVTDMVRFAVREVYDPGQRAALDLDAEFPPAFAQDAERIGIQPADAGKYWAAHWQLPSYEQGAEMLFRNEITPAQFTRLLKALDYAPTWRTPLENIARRIPPISDMIRFAVREVYNPALRKSLGLDDGYPAAFTPEAALHGMDAERAKQYWAAHWKLPSAVQGYHMLWRDEITPAQLDELLQALDYAPKWRPRLANIAHLVPSRVDLRRMLKAGVLDRAQVKKGYQRLGYTLADAETLTVFAEHEAAKGEGGASFAEKAKTRLYTVLHNEYLDGSVDQARARELMVELGVPAAEQTIVLGLWDAERSISRLELTPAQIKKAYSKGLYAVDVATSELVERGMTADDADTFLKE
jgi:hypothetical protein